MAVATTYTCDICGEQKGEANHWQQWWETGRTIHFTTWDSPDADRSMGHLCGPGCAQRKLQEFMEQPR